MKKNIYIAVEDELSEIVLRKLLLEPGQNFYIVSCIGKRGNGYLKKKLPGLIALAPSHPVVVLTDLDQRQCPSDLINDWFRNQNKPEDLIFRVAIKEIESWIMADNKGFSEYCGVPINNIPRTPEDLEDPKQTLLNLVKKHSPRDLRLDLVAESGSGAKQGLSYNNRLKEYVTNRWNPIRAANSAPSLAKARCRIKQLYNR